MSYSRLAERPHSTKQPAIPLKSVDERFDDSRLRRLLARFPAILVAALQSRNPGIVSTGGIQLLHIGRAATALSS
jgi:hypothetical protein